MCIIGFALEQCSEYPVKILGSLVWTESSQKNKVVILNGRDYSFDRPTVDAFLDEKNNLLCGVDLKAGGTWCGMNVKIGESIFFAGLCRGTKWLIQLGTFAAITDFREEEKVEKPTSRGNIVKAFLTGDAINEKE